MKLFLASLAAETLDLIKPLLPSPQGQTLRVAFVTTAADPYLIHPWLDCDRQKLGTMGFHVDNYDIKGKTPANLRTDLASYQLIFVCGGNTFYLLDHVRKSGFDTVIKELLNKGVIYVGSSAGSCIMCPTIEHVQLFDDKDAAPDLKDYTGIGIYNKLILPHFGRSKYADRQNDVMAIAKFKDQILPLRDDQAVMLNGNSIKIVEK